MKAAPTLRSADDAGAPIRAGQAGPLRVATGGAANGSSADRRRRQPARPNRRRGHTPD